MSLDDTALDTPPATKKIDRSKKTALEQSSDSDVKKDQFLDSMELLSDRSTPTTEPSENTPLAETHSKPSNESLASLQLKGSMFTLTVLELRHYRYYEFTKDIADVVKQAPNFFNQTPVVINLDKLDNPDESIDFIDLMQICQEYGLYPVAIKGGNEDHQINALVAGLPQLPSKGSKPTEDQSSTQIKPVELEDEDTEHYTTKVIRHPVRSGQQIYAAGGDLIVLSSVSPGAEILADGHIHVYGSLRGRALAGVKGNQSARIFCQKLEAELISIAGHYKISEDLRGSHWGRGIQASLTGKQLTIKALL